MANYAAFSEDDGQRIARAVTRVEGVPAPARMRRRLPPRALGGGKSTCECPTVIEIELFGWPTGGSVELDWELRQSDSANWVSDAITIPFDAGAADVLAAVEAHSEVTAGTDFRVEGGPLPSTAVYIIALSGGQFGDATLGGKLKLPTLASNDLTGGFNANVSIRMASAYDWGE